MRKRILRFLFHNFSYKISSVFLAIIIWGIIQGEQVLEISKEINVYVEVPDGMMTRGPTHRVRGAIIKGPRVLMLEIPDQLEAKVSIPTKVAGNFRFRLTKKHLTGLDERLNVTIDAPYLDFFVDHTMTRTVPIKELLVGVPAEGFIIKKVSLKPRYIKITGLKSEVIKLKNIPTEPVDITDLNKDYNSAINLIPQSGKKISYSSNLVEISMQVGEEKVNKKFANIPIEVEGSEYVSYVRPIFSSITIQGTPGTINFVKKRDLKAFVEMNSLQPGSYEKDIKVKIPPNTALIEIFPEKVTVKVAKNKKTGPK